MPTAKRTTEAGLLKACMAYLQLRGWWAVRVNSGSFAFGTGKGRRFFRASTPGMSDIVALVPGSARACFCEVKAPTGRQQASQVAFMEAVRAAGAAYVLVRSLRDLEAAVARLEVDADWRGE